MNISDNNSNGSRRLPNQLDEPADALFSAAPPPSPPPTGAANSEAKDGWVTTPAAGFATRAGVKGTE